MMIDPISSIDIDNKQDFELAQKIFIEKTKIQRQFLQQELRVADKVLKKQIKDVPIITICIPTYNRGDRLLSEIKGTWASSTNVGRS